MELNGSSQSCPFFPSQGLRVGVSAASAPFPFLSVFLDTEQAEQCTVILRHQGWPVIRESIVLFLAKFVIFHPLGKVKASQRIWGWRVAASCPVQKTEWQKQMAFVPLKLRNTWKINLFSPFLSAGSLSIQNVQILEMGLFLGSPGLHLCELKEGSGFPVLSWFCLPPHTAFCLSLLCCCKLDLWNDPKWKLSP